MDDKQKSKYSRMSMRMGERVKEFLPSAEEKSSDAKAVKRELTGKTESNVARKKIA